MKRAFSLIELLIVLVIIATASAIAVPKMVESEARWRVTGAARCITADIAEARSYAIASSADVTITFARDGYTVTSARDGLIRSVDVTARPYHAALTGADFGGVRDLVFNGFGSGSADGTLTIAADGFQCSIAVGSETGAAKVGDLQQSSGGGARDRDGDSGSLGR